MIKGLCISRDGSLKIFGTFQIVFTKYIDFDELHSLIKSSSPRLFPGAVDILPGDFNVVDSLNPREIRTETLTASVGITNLFKTRSRLCWVSPPADKPALCRYKWKIRNPMTTGFGTEAGSFLSDQTGRLAASGWANTSYETSFEMMILPLRHQGTKKRF